MQAAMTFTESARLYIKKMVEKQNGLGFRLSIKKTGCSGYSYFPAVVETINPTDILLEMDNGIKIFIDPVWLHLLDNLQVDYIEEDKAGLKQKKLVFINAKESSRCGCGESFHIEKNE